MKKLRARKGKYCEYKPKKTLCGVCWSFCYFVECQRPGKCVHPVHQLQRAQVCLFDRSKQGLTNGFSSAWTSMNRHLILLWGSTLTNSQANVCLYLCKPVCLKCQPYDTLTTEQNIVVVNMESTFCTLVSDRCCSTVSALLGSMHRQRMAEATDQILADHRLRWKSFQCLPGRTRLSHARLVVSPGILCLEPVLPSCPRRALSTRPTADARANRPRDPCGERSVVSRRRPRPRASRMTTLLWWFFCVVQRRVALFTCLAERCAHLASNADFLSEFHSGG